MTKLLVSKSRWETLFYVAHYSAMAEHLGWDKTSWPVSIGHVLVHRCCSACHKVQLVNLPPHIPKASPSTDQGPIQHHDMDLIGSLEQSALGHLFVSVLLDNTTWNQWLLGCGGTLPSRAGQYGITFISRYNLKHGR